MLPVKLPISLSIKVIRSMDLGGVASKELAERAEICSANTGLHLLVRLKGKNS